MTQTDTIILDRVVLVKVEARIYGARKKLKKEDLVLADGSKLPPDDLASLGSKRLLDPEQLAVFNRLEKRSRTHLFADRHPLSGRLCYSRASRPRLLPPNWSALPRILPPQKPGFWPAMMPPSLTGWCAIRNLPHYRKGG